MVMSLSDAEVMAASTPVASGPAPAGITGLTDAQVASASAPSMAESLWRGGAEGATLGFGDEIGLLSRERQAASRRANPWTHFLGEMLGTVAPMAAAAPLAAVRGAGLAARAARTVGRPLAVGDVSTLPRSIGQGVKLGAVYGGIGGAGHTETSPDAIWGQALGERARGAVGGGVMGGVLGAPLGAAGYGVSRAAQLIGGARAAARAETADASSGALVAASRAFQRDRITPDELIAQIRGEFPTDTVSAGGPGVRFWGPANAPAAQRGVWTADMVDDLVRRSLAGETAADISAAMRQGGRGPGVASVRTLLNELSERHAVPLNIADRAKLVGRPGAGENVGWTLRAASATPGAARATARERLVERQLSQGPRLSEHITNHIGTPDFEGRSAQLAKELAQRNSALYNQAELVDAMQIQQGNPINLQPVLDGHAVKWVYSRGPVATAIREAIDAFRPAVLGGPANQPVQRSLGSIREFMQAKQELQALFDKYATNKTVLRELMAFKNDLYGAVGKHNPAWRVANDAAADGFAAQRALQLGTEFAGRVNNQTREQLAKFRAMSEPEQELYRIGVAQALNDRLMNRQGTHDLTSELRLPGARAALRTILGDKAANKFFRAIDREFATTRTYREQFGSQTTPLREAIDDLSWAPQLASAWQLMSPQKIAEQTAIWAARQMNERRNQNLLEMLTTQDPIRQLNFLRSVQPVHAARTRAGRVAGVVGTGSAAPFANAITGVIGANLAPPPLPVR